MGNYSWDAVWVLIRKVLQGSYRVLLNSSGLARQLLFSGLHKVEGGLGWGLQLGARRASTAPNEQ